MRKRLRSLTLLFFASCSAVVAGNTGKITGVVTDEKTGEELVGASVVLEGSTRGAATNVDGYYVILNVPPGKYTLVASAVGYNKKTVAGISVSIDLTTTINFGLTSSLVEQEEVVVTAEKPVIQKDLTAKTAVVGGDEISVLPVTEVGQVLSLQAGFVNGSLRGGRSGEVAYWIDGVPVTDAYDGGQVVEVNKSIISELQLVSGAFNAEYGQAMSGIVNIATKEGGTKFTGGIGTYFGDYISTDNKLFPGIDKVSPTAIRNFEANVSGPILGEDLTFFANGRYIYFDGYLSGYRRFNPWNIAVTDTLGRFQLFRDPAGRGDSARVPMNWSERKYAQGKLTWRITPLLKASLNFIYDNTEAKKYDATFNDRRMYFFNPDGYGTNHDTSNTYIFQLSHTLSSNTFYTLGISYFDKRLSSYVYEDPNDPRYTHPQLTRTDDSYSWYTGGTDLSRFQRKTRTFLGKLDLSSQLDQSNLVKVGVEVRRHRLTLLSYNLVPIQSQQAFDPQRSNPYVKTEIPPVSSNSYNTYDHRPTEMSAYIQDKLEFKDFILNIGLRFDYFQPDGVVLADESDPNIFSPIKAENIAKSLDERRTYWYKKASAKSQFSPRIGASFPITERGVVHFSYGHFFQIPRFERLYENPDFKIGFGTGNQGTIGNADLKPEQTINGEIGVQQQIGDDISLDLTAYIRDIRSLTTTGADQIKVFGGSATYAKYQNRDFGYAKGIVLTVDKRFASGLSATLDYTYQIARGSGSDPNQTLNLITSGSLPEIQLTPLAWDQRHTVNITASYNQKHWGVSTIAQYGSGAPYTPRRSQDISTLLTNSQTKPDFFNVDARAHYEIPLDPLRLVMFLRVFNLLDLRNETNVFDDTGRSGFTTDYEKALGERTLQRVNTIEQFFTRPANYSEPRRLEFGMNLEF